MNAGDAPLEAAADGRPIAGGPIFGEPWEAQAFAMVVALHQAGLFAWPEWTAALSRQIAGAGGPRGGGAADSYYLDWLAALESLVVAKGVTTRELLEARKAAWERAAEATPHGAPILLDNDPEARSDPRRMTP